MTKNYSWNDKVVLVVEDDTSSLMLIKTILSKTGAKILVAEDGETAIDLVQNDVSIDLILMDIRLKGLNGLEATKQIKQIKPNTPVIAQTACAIIGDMEKCLDAGCNAYITKPIERNLLLETMDYYFKMSIAQGMFDNVMYSN
ncbi:MAG: response regulator [Bacteroidales bacterium]|jgi:CheY-like chemotaxis protein|nr:response regulator [Bacteroidales bacterium]MDD4385261.1 response regulator [Bacteroidales bacterium]MDY0198012.1 response regulator [Tenuifilaceae bacterium]